MPGLHVLCLEGDDLALAYPLVRSAARIAPSEWRTFTDDLIGSGGGVLGVQADARCLYGLATFHPRTTLRHGRALCVELLVAVELGRRQSVREVLRHRLTDIARANACDTIIVTISSSAPAQLLEAWREWGFADAGSSLVCRLDTSASSEPRRARAASHE